MQEAKQKGPKARIEHFGRGLIALGDQSDQRSLLVVLRIHFQAVLGEIWQCTITIPRKMFEEKRELERRRNTEFNSRLWRPGMNYRNIAALCALSATVVFAQSFSSGSTGADGALDLTSGDKALQLPDSGILNYTTINIPAERTLSFINNLQNTPVIMLAQGAVNISGTIQVSPNEQSPDPGPGGFYGGSPGQGGFGPAGGQPSGPLNGSWVGPLSLVPIIGGSGGAGTLSTVCGRTSSGGGGGGALVIASSASVTVAHSATIAAYGKTVPAATLS